METDYEPYGKQWETEMMKMRKADIIEMFRQYATQEQDYDFEADVDYVSKKLSDKMWESTKQQQPAVEDKRKEFAIKNKIAVGELICPHCGTIKHGAFDENKCPWCEKPYFATPPTEPAQSEDELLDNIVKIVKSAWTPDSEPTPPANKKD